jgi:hypothetical protein
VTKFSPKQLKIKPNKNGTWENFAFRNGFSVLTFRGFCKGGKFAFLKSASNSQMFDSLYELQYFKKKAISPLRRAHFSIFSIKKTILAKPRKMKKVR